MFLFLWQKKLKKASMVFDKNKKKKSPVQMDHIDVMPNTETLHPLSKSIISILDARSAPYAVPNDEPERKSYTYDPQSGLLYSGLYRRRLNLLPYVVLKQMAENNELLACILNTRGNQLSLFGQPQVSRYDIGYKIVYRKPSEINKLPTSLKQSLDEKIKYIRDLFYNCGKTDNLQYHQRVTLPEFLQGLAKAAPLYGFPAVEIIKGKDNLFHSFRLVDSGTIYRAPYLDFKLVDQRGLPDNPLYKQVQSDFLALDKLRGKEQIRYDRLNLQSFINGEYAWVQVINEIPRMAFKDDELLVHNYYPSTSVDYAGYPIPPLDDVARSLTTNLNSMMHNHLFFFQGRAAKGGLVIKSDQINENVLNRIRLHMNASINSVRNAFRMPIVGIPKEDEIDYVSFDQPGNRDQEFAYLSENTARLILSNYQVAPEELSAMAYLSRGTVAGQPIAESNNEYRLQVARSAGFKPLLYHTQVLMNRILSIIDPEVHKYCIFKFVGLEADDPQKEVTRLQTEMNVYSTMNDTLNSVEKSEVPVAGNIPLNPQFLNMAKENVPMNVFLYAFTGNKSLLLDPSLNFYQSGFWFQYQSIFQGLLKSKGRVKHCLEEYTAELKDLFAKQNISEVGIPTAIEENVDIVPDDEIMEE